MGGEGRSGSTSACEQGAVAMGEWVIEPATVEAMPDILQIEEACFSAPWTRKMLEAELSGNPFAHFLLAKQAPPGEVGSVSIVGYLCFWVVFEEVRLMNLAVIESMRHKGIARALVMQALEVGLAQAARCAVLEVRASNHAAHALYRQSWVSRRDDPANVLYQSHRRCIADGTGPDCVGVWSLDTRSRSRRRTYHATAVISSPGGATC